VEISLLGEPIILLGVEIFLFGEPIFLLGVDIFLFGVEWAALRAASALFDPPVPTKKPSSAAQKAPSLYF
jgi:hypothetical protein